MWCKQACFDLVARVPMMMHVPWMPQSQGVRTAALVEAVDLMPTYLDLAGIATSTWDYGQLEGTSMVPLLQGAGATGDVALAAAPSWKNATFSQYPRCASETAGVEPWAGATDNACTAVARGLFDAMGYTMRTDRYRYTVRPANARAAANCSRVI